MSYFLYIKTNNPYLEEKYKSSSIAYEGDAGIDLYIPETILIPPKSTIGVSFEISCQMKETQTDQFVSYWLIPRSSICKTPLRMSNSIGLIDSGYRNHLKAFVDNISDQEYKIEQGTRLFQIVGPHLEKIVTIMTSELSSSERGLQGFGSSGK